MLFTLALSTFTGLLFGLAPALQASRAEVASTLRQQSAALASAGGGARVRRILVVAQLSLSLLLLVGAGLFARSLFNLLHVDPGFRTERLLTFAIDPSLNGYTNERGFALFHDLQERLARLPGVVAAGAANPGPLTHSNRGSNVTVEGYQAREDEDMDVSRHVGGSRLFSRAGHARGARTRSHRARSQVARQSSGGQRGVCAALLRRCQSAGPPHDVRRQQSPNCPTAKSSAWCATSNTPACARPPNPPFTPPTPTTKASAAWSSTCAASAIQRALGAQVRRLVQQMDAGLPVFDMQPVEIQVEESIEIDRLIAILSCAFGLLATLLAAIGLYGLVAYTVARRTAEIGIRVALGAVPRDVLWLVMKDVGTLVIFGLGHRAAGGAGARPPGRVAAFRLEGRRSGDLRGRLAGAGAGRGAVGPDSQQPRRAHRSDRRAAA